MLPVEEFEYVRNLVRRQVGIVLEDDKEYLVETRLSPIANQVGVASISDLIRKVRNSHEPLLATDVVEAMITSETLFFRDVHPFDALKSSIMPRLLQLRGHVKEVHIWSAGCSTGQEPYSIAMLLREHFGALRDWKFTITATDVSQKNLARAREGIYDLLEVNRGLPAAMLVKYFDKEGTQWKVRPEVRDMVEFRQLNLSGEWNGLAPADVVFLRNVLIYFDTPTKTRILQRVHSQLRSHGVLILGGSETTLNLSTEFGPSHLHKTTLYTRVVDAAPLVGSA